MGAQLTHGAIDMHIDAESGADHIGRRDAGLDGPGRVVGGFISLQPLRTGMRAYVRHRLAQHGGIGIHQRAVAAHEVATEDAAHEKRDVAEVDGLLGDVDLDESTAECGDQHWCALHDDGIGGAAHPRRRIVGDQQEFCGRSCAVARCRRTGSHQCDAGDAEPGPAHAHWRSSTPAQRSTSFTASTWSASSPSSRCAIRIKSAASCSAGEAPF